MSSWLRQEAEYGNIPVLVRNPMASSTDVLEQFGLRVLAEVERRLAQSCDCDECSSGKKGALDVVRLLREG